MKMTSTLFCKKPKSFQSVAKVDRLEDLDAIHETDINISIFERDIHDMKHEAQELMNGNFDFKHSGTKAEILSQLTNQLEIARKIVPSIVQDITALINEFESISSSKTFRLNILTVNSNMCRRFHSDINDLRLLCTYIGQGTYWLPEKAVNRTAYHHGGGNDEIIRYPKLVQQATEGDVLILKGALYPNANAIIHRSPSVEESGEKRLLLRIDTNETFNI